MRAGHAPIYLYRYQVQQRRDGTPHESNPPTTHANDACSSAGAAYTGSREALVRGHPQGRSTVGARDCRGAKCPKDCRHSHITLHHQAVCCLFSGASLWRLWARLRRPRSRPTSSGKRLRCIYRELQKAQGELSEAPQLPSNCRPAAVVAARRTRGLQGLC